MKEIWQQYTEELYRGEPNATDSFNENIHDNEPEVKDGDRSEGGAHTHTNRK